MKTLITLWAVDVGMGHDLPEASDLTADSDIETVAHAMYYEACISDSTYHGTDYARATDVAVSWAKSTDSPVDNFTAADDKFQEVLQEKKA